MEANQKKCNTCKGFGRVPTSKFCNSFKQCKRCGGKGYTLKENKPVELPKEELGTIAKIKKWLHR